MIAVCGSPFNVCRVALCRGLQATRRAHHDATLIACQLGISYAPHDFVQEQFFEITTQLITAQLARSREPCAKR
jgi:hypothetical protein